MMFQASRNLMIYNNQLTEQPYKISLTSKILVVTVSIRMPQSCVYAVNKIAAD